MDEILKKFGDLGIVPVVKIDNAADAVSSFTSIIILQLIIGG